MLPLGRGQEGLNLGVRRARHGCAQLVQTAAQYRGRGASRGASRGAGERLRQDGADAHARCRRGGRGEGSALGRCLGDVVEERARRAVAVARVVDVTAIALREGLRRELAARRGQLRTEGRGERLEAGASATGAATTTLEQLAERVEDGEAAGDRGDGAGAFLAVISGLLLLKGLAAPNDIGCHELADYRRKEVGGLSADITGFVRLAGDSDLLADRARAQYRRCAHHGRKSTPDISGFVGLAGDSDLLAHRAGTHDRRRAHHGGKSAADLSGFVYLAGDGDLLAGRACAHNGRRAYCGGKSAADLSGFVCLAGDGDLLARSAGAHNRRRARYGGNSGADISVW